MKRVPQFTSLRYQWIALCFVVVCLTTSVAQLREADEPMHATLRRPTALTVVVTSSSFENKGGLVAFNITNGTGSWARVRITDATFVVFDGVLPPEETDISRQYIQGWPMYIWEMSLPPREYQIEVTGENVAKSASNLLLDSASAI